MSRLLRTWRDSHVSRPLVGGSAGVSVLAHAAVIVAAVIGTRAAPEMIRERLADAAVRFHVPKDRPMGQSGSVERIQWSSLGVGVGTGELVDAPDGQGETGRKEAPAPGLDIGNAAVDMPALPRLPGFENAYTIVEVDSTVQRDPFSAAPAYPADLLAKGVQGSAMVRYVVDTTGRADMRTFQVISATHPGFADAVREAMPLMRFTPAKIGVHRVRQLVEQPFNFEIAPATATAQQAGRRVGETRP